MRGDYKPPRPVMKRIAFMVPKKIAIKNEMTCNPLVTIVLWIFPVIGVHLLLSCR